MSAVAFLAGLLAGVCALGAGAAGVVAVVLSGAFSSAGGGGNMVASIDSGGATSGVLIGKLGADQSRAMRLP